MTTEAQTNSAFNPTATTLRAKYLELCNHYQITPNSIFRDLLPDQEGQGFAVTALDFSRNYVGDRGMIAVAEVLRHCPDVKELNFKNNGLRNKAVIALVNVLKEHPSVESINLSSNYISTGAGHALEELLEANPRIKAVDISNTKIEPEIRVKIADIIAQRQ